MAIPTQTDPVTGQRYLLLADISGYTAFLNGVEEAHGVDFSSGLPAGYEVLGALLDVVIEGVQPAFQIAKLEGDAVFAVASAEDLDGQGDPVLDRLQAVYRAFSVVREERKKSASDHICTGCPVVGSLDLKMVLHRGQTVRQTVGSHPELLGPAVAGDQVLGERVDVLERGTGLLEVGGEDQGVGRLADAVLLGGLQLRGTEILERLDDSAVGLCAFRVHDNRAF